MHEAKQINTLYKRKMFIAEGTLRCTECTSSAPSPCLAGTLAQYLLHEKKTQKGLRRKKVLWFTLRTSELCISMYLCVQVYNSATLCMPTQKETPRSSLGLIPNIYSFAALFIYLLHLDILHSEKLKPTSMSSQEDLTICFP